MKKLLVIAAAVVMFAATTAAAQNRVLGKADVPFTFAAHQQQFGPGQYVVRQLGHDIIRIEDAATGRGVTLVGAIAGDSTAAKLTFHRYGQENFLTAIASPVASAELPKSNEEKKAASRNREMAKIALTIH